VPWDALPETWFGSRILSWVPNPDKVFTFQRMGYPAWSDPADSGSVAYNMWKSEPYSYRFRELPRINGRIELHGQKLLGLSRRITNMVSIRRILGTATQDDLRTAVFHDKSRPITTLHVIALNTDFTDDTYQAFLQTTSGEFPDFLDVAPPLFDPSRVKISIPTDSLPGDAQGYCVVNLTNRSLWPHQIDGGGDSLSFDVTLKAGEAQLFHVAAPSEDGLGPDFSIHGRDLTTVSNGVVRIIAI